MASRTDQAVHGLARLVLQVLGQSVPPRVLGQSGVANAVHLTPYRLGVFVVARPLQSCIHTHHRRY